jgi:hypothetical protein
VTVSGQELMAADRQSPRRQIFGQRLAELAIIGRGAIRSESPPVALLGADPS